VIGTGHQVFLTREALMIICETTLESVSAFEAGQPLINEICLEYPRTFNSVKT